MGTLKGEISDIVEDEFRKTVAIKYGLKKGNISNALEDIIRDWLLRQKKGSNSSKAETTSKIELLKHQFPDEFIAIDDNWNVIAHSKLIMTLYENIDPNIVVRIIKPEISVSKQPYKRQLGWQLKRKQNVI